jgi:hypothetical protein
MDVVLGEEQDRLKAMINELKNRKGRHTNADKKLRAILEQQLEARKIANNAGVLDEFARLLDKKPTNQYALDAIQARDPRMAGARLENLPAASRPMFNPEVQRDMLRQFAGQPVVNADYDNVGRLRARVAAQYADAPTMNTRPVPTNLGYPAAQMNYTDPMAPSFIKKDPISVTGTTDGDKKMNEVIKATEKVEKAGAAADKATGGLWSKLKAVQPVQFLKGAGAFTGGATIGNALGRAVAPEGYEDFGGMAGGLIGGIGGAALTATPYVGTPLAVIGALTTGKALYDTYIADDEKQQQAPTLDQLAGATTQQAQPVDRLGEMLQALTAANIDIANMRSDTKQRLINRGNQAANIDPELLR